MVCQCTLNAVAYSVLAYAAYCVFKAIYKIVYPFYLASAADLHQLAGARWAVVTGATDGIGKAYATEFAKKGFNVVLVSRTQSKLDATKEELAQKCPNIEIKTIAFDFTLANLDDYNKTLLDELKKLEIGVLVNNVGVSYEYPEVVHKIEGGNERLRDLVVVNTLPTTILTATVLSQMTTRHKGIIINISSSAAFAPMQLLATYSATKKYVNHFTEALKKLEIGVLVNNVGVSYEYPEVVHKIEGGNERLRDLVVVNTLPTTILTATVLSQMTTRHKGIIINISSSAAFAPMQLLATYSATKKYVNHFTEAVRREYAGQGITIQTVCPLMVATKLSKIRRSSFFAPFPEFFVKQALRTVGYVSETTGCFAHELQALVFALPDFLVDYVIAAEHKKTRAIALKKRSKTE
uniref:Uncharacterized protein n=1 Tax=Panagrolaimus sp. JU765 TaxID=591449 RepID=A0AC34QMF5_9BILA